jgi:hypothetical protein
MIHKNYILTHTPIIHYVDTSVGNLNCSASCKYFNAENTENRSMKTRQLLDWGIQIYVICKLIYYWVPIYDWSFLCNF